MAASVSEQCRTCVTTLKAVASILSGLDKQPGRVHHEQVNDELERFSLWMGNIGSLHQPESPMSLEYRLREENDVLAHVLELLDDLKLVAGELLEFISAEHEEEGVPAPNDDSGEESRNNEMEFLEEIAASITRLFRVSRLVHHAAPSDRFTKALSRDRYRFNDQFDIAHVGEKYPKLATREFEWLQKRLGRAITHRRHYLSYIQDHREELEATSTYTKAPAPAAPKSQAPIERPQSTGPPPDSSSRPSMLFTKATSLTPGHVTAHMLAAEEEFDPEDDVSSYTTISRSTGNDLDCSASDRIPTLDKLRRGSKREVECPFCFRIKKFKNERMWRKHVFSDLRSYVCTFRDCDAPYFSNINEWFRHEMQTHRVSYRCLLYQDKIFQVRASYLAHVRKHHPNMLEDGDEQSALDIARRPVDRIPAQKCPCCTEWVDRLNERETGTGMVSDASGFITFVTPTVFKLHLASHLERLALFAIPIGSATEGDVYSNAAIEENWDVLPETPHLSTFSFNSSGPPSSASKGQLNDDNLAQRRRDSCPEEELGDFCDSTRRMGLRGENRLSLNLGAFLRQEEMGNNSNAPSSSRQQPQDPQQSTTAPRSTSEATPESQSRPQSSSTSHSLPYQLRFPHPQGRGSVGR